MSRSTTNMLTIALTLLLAAAAAPTGHAQDDGDTEGTDGVAPGLCVDCFHCPYHPHHCGLANLTSANGTISSEAAVSVEGELLGLPAAVGTNASGALVFNLTNQGAQAGAALDVTVAVEPVLGLTWLGGTNQTVQLLGANASQASFSFLTAAVWPAGDLVFPRYSIGEGGEWVTSFAALQVGSAASAPDESLLPWGPLAPLALVAAAALLLARRRKL